MRKMDGIKIAKLTKEYLNLVILQYSLAVLVWVLMIFVGSGFDWALAVSVCDSMGFVGWGWRIIFIDAAKGCCSGLYRGLPISSAKHRASRCLAAVVGLVIILAGFVAMTALIWSRIQFWGVQYVYSSGGWGSRHYVQWLYQINLEGGGMP